MAPPCASSPTCASSTSCLAACRPGDVRRRSSALAASASCLGDALAVDLSLPRAAVLVAIPRSSSAGLRPASETPLRLGRRTAHAPPCATHLRPATTRATHPHVEHAPRAACAAGRTACARSTLLVPRHVARPEAESRTARRLGRACGARPGGTLYSGASGTLRALGLGGARRRALCWSGRPHAVYIWLAAFERLHVTGADCKMKLRGFTWRALQLDATPEAAPSVHGQSHRAPRTSLDTRRFYVGTMGEGFRGRMGDEDAPLQWRGGHATHALLAGGTAGCSLGHGHSSDRDGNRSTVAHVMCP